jgi:hypothetical protein
MVLKTPQALPKTIVYPEIAVINESTVVSNALAASVTGALRVQVERDFAPEWGLMATINFYPDKTKVKPAAWQFVLLDDADQAGALGYHEVTPNGQPLGKVFVKTSTQNHIAWSTTASHEMLELLADSYTDLQTIVPTGNTTATLVAYEVCDPVENDSYAIGGVLVSNFVLPQWFEGDATAAHKWDFLGNLKAPLSLSPGGYMSVMQITTNKGWQQVTARDAYHGQVCRADRPRALNAVQPESYWNWFKQFLTKV